MFAASLRRAWSRACSHFQKRSMSDSKASMSTSARRPAIKGVIFDMDGTLTQPFAIDFGRMRSRIPIPEGKCILEHSHSLPEAEKKRAFQIIEEEEEKGLAQTKMQPGFDELMAFLAEQKIERGVVTRNSRTAVDHVFPTPDEYFSVVLTRDFDGGYKPDPAPLLHIRDKWELESHHCIMVGDHIDDLQAASNAKMASVLLANQSNSEFHEHADHVIESLDDIIKIIKNINKQHL